MTIGEVQGELRKKIKKYKHKRYGGDSYKAVIHFSKALDEINRGLHSLQANGINPDENPFE